MSKRTVTVCDVCGEEASQWFPVGSVDVCKKCEDEASASALMRRIREAAKAESAANRLGNYLTAQQVQGRQGGCTCLQKGLSPCPVHSRAL